MGFRVPGSGFQVPVSGFQCPGSVFRVPGFRYQVLGSGFRFPGSGFCVRVPGSEFRVSNLELKILWTGSGGSPLDPPRRRACPERHSRFPSAPAIRSPAAKSQSPVGFLGDSPKVADSRYKS